MSTDPISSGMKAHTVPAQEWLSARTEDIVDPDLRIIDAHHHIWDQPGNRYMFDDVLRDVRSGHNVVGSVYVQSLSMYRADGQSRLAPVGETEFANGIAAQSASGNYGHSRVCAGIVGSGDLTLGAGLEEVLHAHIRAGGGRFRGIRPTLAWHESSDVRAMDIEPHILMTPEARKAISCLNSLDLSLDVWVFFTQLDEVIDVCRRFPELTVIVNHFGGPLGIGPYSKIREEALADWRAAIRKLASCPNAKMKLGGLGMRYAGFQFDQLSLPPDSDLLAREWHPYIDFCVTEFGPDRCMFESNFPVDRRMSSYHILWNAFKKATRDYSSTERDRLFSGTAICAYRLQLPD